MTLRANQFTFASVVSAALALSAATLHAQEQEQEQAQEQEQDQPRVMRMQCLTCTATCSCYWSSECGSGETCDYGSGCTHSGKKDGTCSKSKGGGFTAGEFANSASLLFKAFLDSPSDTSGPPDIHLTEAAQEVSLPADAHYAVQSVVHNALDVALGFDFIQPQTSSGYSENGAIAPGGLGQLRLRRSELGPDAIAMAKAVETAVLKAIKGGNPELVAGPIDSFWQTHPRYEPHHTGRCWRHGHGDYPYKSVKDCQIQELQLLVRAFVREKPVSR